jgi:predicted ester cyclase
MKTSRVSKFVVMVLLVIVGMVVTFAGNVAAQSDEPACEGEYLESVREVGIAYIDALNTMDLDPWYALLADDYENYGTGDFIPMDREAALLSAEGIMAVFPGFQTEIHMSTVSADCRFVTFIWTSSGTNDGPIGEIPPTGIATAVSGISVTEVVDGKIVHEWISYDQFTLFSKLGLVTLGAPAKE